MDPVLLLSIIGSIASLVSLLIAGPQKNSQIIHFIYAVALTAVAGGSMFFISGKETELTIIKSRVAHYEEISKNATRILKTYEYSADVGENRGFVLMSFAFLETYKEDFPEMYLLTKDLVKEGFLVTKSASDRDLSERWNEEKRMKDGAQTMRAILEGLIKE